ncbi:uncharacterized protein [Penaeus vannamei]|uniref:uncharacterized protein n=1 Tax=Penaeus vannamei TaxID=6689 RepID=UPI00387F4E9C
MSLVENIVSMPATGSHAGRGLFSTLVGKTGPYFHDECLPLSGMSKMPEHSVTVVSSENEYEYSVTGCRESSNVEMFKESPSTHSPAVQLSSEATASNDISDKDVGKRLNTKATPGEKSDRTSAEAKVETPVAKISPTRMSFKRPRTPLSDENLGDPLEKRARIVTDTANEAQSKTEKCTATSTITVNQDILIESSAGETAREEPPESTFRISVSGSSSAEESGAMVPLSKLSEPLTVDNEIVSRSSIVLPKQSMVSITEELSMTITSEHADAKENGASVFQPKTTSAESQVDELMIPSPQGKPMQHTPSAVNSAKVQSMELRNPSPAKMLPGSVETASPGREERCLVCGKFDCPFVLDKKLKTIFTKTQSLVKRELCSMCGRSNCPLILIKKSKPSIVLTSKESLVGKLRSPSVRSVLSPPSVKSRRVNALIRRNIGTKIAANGLFKGIANRSSPQTIKLEAELFKSVENGDLARVQELIEATGAAVRRSKTSCTLLHAAASHNQADVVMFLLQLISPNITNEEGQTPAHVAAEKGHTQVLKILVRDPDFDADKRDYLRNSVKTLLGGHLFKAVLEGNKRDAERLLAVGADPDSHGGKLVDGVLARELGVTTPRLLASALNMESIVTLFDKKASKGCSQTVESKSLPSSALSTVHIKVPTRQFRVRRATTIEGGADVYKMDKKARGFVRIFNFSCFKDRSDLNLQQLDYDARTMSDVFDKMGYMCKTHSSLTAQQTKEVMKNIRDGDELKDVGCAIFVISGYGVNGRKILTTDMKFVDTDYILNLFKDSECPQLKNKPKLFIFNLYNTSEVPTNSGNQTPKVVRLTDPLKDMACIYSNSIGLNCVPNGKGTSFSWSLCRALADHSAEQELGDLYREFLKEYSKSSPSSSPELRYFGFTKKFFFNPM